MTGHDIKTNAYGTTSTVLPAQDKQHNYLKSRSLVYSIIQIVIVE